jgi:hypothetical protein
METGNVVPERKDGCPKRACHVTDGSYGIPGKSRMFIEELAGLSQQVPFMGSE